MHINVAWSAKGDAIVYVCAQLRKIFERLDVVSVNPIRLLALSNVPASLACESVAL